MRRQEISAVIDTGAGVSVCSSKLAEELKLVMTPWRKNRLVAIDGKEITPGGAAWLSVSDGVTRVEGEVLILDGDIELLLGEDFLKKLGTRMKIGTLPEIVIDELPIGAVRNEERKSRKRAVLREAVWLPGKAMEVMTTEPLDLEEGRNSVMVEPSEPLMKTKRVSVERAVADGKKARTWTEVGKRLREVQERQKQRCDASHRTAEEFQQGEEDKQTMADAGKETNAMEDVPTDTRQEEPSKESAKEGGNDGAGRDETAFGTGA
jgi:predicted aspartyl protease